VPREDEASIFSVVIYLNEGYSGGRTSFFHQKPGCRGTGTDIASGGAPAMGTALVFDHSVWHRGDQLRPTRTRPTAASGWKAGVELECKWILKTEIIFRRVAVPLRFLCPLSAPAAAGGDGGGGGGGGGTGRYAYRRDPRYLEARALYDASRAFEAAGERERFVETYAKVLALQCCAAADAASAAALLAREGATPAGAAAGLVETGGGGGGGGGGGEGRWARGLPAAALLRVFCHLGGPRAILTAGSACAPWFARCRDSAVWFEVHARCWSVASAFERARALECAAGGGGGGGGGGGEGGEGGGGGGGGGKRSGDGGDGGDCGDGDGGALELPLFSRDWYGACRQLAVLQRSFCALVLWPEPVRVSAFLALPQAASTLSFHRAERARCKLRVGFKQLVQVRQLVEAEDGTSKMQPTAAQPLFYKPLAAAAEVAESRRPRACPGGGKGQGAVPPHAHVYAHALRVLELPVAVEEAHNAYHMNMVRATHTTRAWWVYHSPRQRRAHLQYRNTCSRAWCMRHGSSARWYYLLFSPY
jgi:hypothetical protein